MENEFILVKEQLPEKGKDIIGIDKDGNKHYCFRCACPNPNCKEWRCSLTGGGLIIDVVKWIYEPMLDVVLCPDCFGDGIKTCHNPDHGFLSGVLGAVYGANESSCPCCGHSSDHKMKGKCYTCDGTGQVSKEDYDNYIDEFVDEDDRDVIDEHCLKNHA